MIRNPVETFTGAGVLLISLAFLAFAYSVIQVNFTRGYPVMVILPDIGGLGVGSDVKVSGIRVGEVTARQLDPQTLNAIVTLSISNDIKLPSDTVATLASEGPLGAKFVQLEPGTSTEVIVPGGKITKNKSYKSLEDQVGEIIFYATQKNSPSRN